MRLRLVYLIFRLTTEQYWVLHDDYIGVWASKNPPIEIFGAAGTISVPDPNKFSESVEILTSENREWKTVEPTAGYIEGGRGIGLADMSIALAGGFSHRALGEVAFHILEIMESIITSGYEGKVIKIQSTCERPAVVPLSSLT